MGQVEPGLLLNVEVGQLVGGPIIGVVATALTLRAGIVATGLLLTPVLGLLLLGVRQTRIQAASVPDRA